MEVLTLRALSAEAALPQRPQSPSKWHEAAVQFEGLLMSQVFQTLRKTVKPSGLFGQDQQARSTYEYLLDQAVIEQSLKGGKGWGLSERLEHAWKSSTRDSLLDFSKPSADELSVEG